MARSGPSRSKSNYHSPLRARQAAETRRAIVEAARHLFAEAGWSATTVPMLARAAGVSVDTIYASFGTKSALLLVAVDVAIVGDDAAPPMTERSDFALLGRGGRAQRLRAGVRYTMDVYARSIPILRTLRQAAASDAAAAARLRRFDEERHAVTAAGMALVLGAEAPAPVVDAIWALVSPDVHTALIDDRGWPTAQVEDWFVAQATAALSS